MAEPSSLHEHAVQAENHLEQLATGLAKAGAEDDVLQTVTKMAEVARKIVMALGKGQEETGDEEPPAPAPRPTTASAVASMHQDTSAPR